MKIKFKFYVLAALFLVSETLMLLDDFGPWNKSWRRKNFSINVIFKNCYIVEKKS